MFGTFSDLRFKSSQLMISHGVLVPENGLLAEKGAVSPVPFKYITTLLFPRPVHIKHLARVPLSAIGKWKLVSACTHLFPQPTQKAPIMRLLWATSEHSSDSFFLAMDCRFSVSATLVQLPSRATRYKV